MLDTNIASDLISSSRLDQRIAEHSNSRLAISCLTEAELLYGITRKPEAKRLHSAVTAFLETIDICDFNSAAAAAYARLRAECQPKGIGIGSIDTLIAGHALSLGMTLVTRGGALQRLSPWLSVEAW